MIVPDTRAQYVLSAKGKDEKNPYWDGNLTGDNKKFIEGFDFALQTVPPRRSQPGVGARTLRRGQGRQLLPRRRVPGAVPDAPLPVMGQTAPCS